MSYFSERLKAARESLAPKLSQAEMAKLLDETRENYNSLENGRRKFPRSKFQEAEKILGLKPDIMRAWQLIDEWPENSLMRQSLEEVVRQLEEGATQETLDEIKTVKALREKREE